VEGTKLDLNLETLKKNRDALLLAEVGVWLHMLGKYHENFLKIRTVMIKRPMISKNFIIT